MHALIINRSGGLERYPGARPEAVNPRAYMWDPPPEPPKPPEREATNEDFAAIFGVSLKSATLAGQRRAQKRKAKEQASGA